ncbi:MAG: DNA-directed RNA polymerase subunit delta [Bacilli bacterium]|nr:DNA-directed RNA polymerase subunit delta [Bacilli bacterium]
MECSLIEIAYEYVSGKKDSSSFKDIWAYVVEKAELTPEEAAAKVSRFYTNLMLDGRFVTLGENEWDLRVRHTFDKVHIDMKDVYSEVDSEDDVDSEEKEEEDEYNAAFEEKKPSDEENLNIDGNEAEKVEEEDSSEDEDSNN